MKEFLETELERLLYQQADQNTDALNAAAAGYTQQANIENKLGEQTLDKITEVVIEMEKEENA